MSDVESGRALMAFDGIYDIGRWTQIVLLVLKVSLDLNLALEGWTLRSLALEELLSKDQQDNFAISAHSNILGQTPLYSRQS